MADFRKGDIVQNIFAAKGNPYRFLIYMGKGTCRQGRYVHKTYDCIGYDGSKVQLFRDPDGLVCIGHMQEFDEFLDALAALKDRKENYDA